MDGRVERGDRTRQRVAAQAAAIASVNGLCGMTYGQLAGELGISKSTVQAAYGSKEEVQLAAVAVATETFVAEVVTPALDADEGLVRLLALVDSWLGYVERRVFPGGCFMVATLAEFDSLRGPVSDALARARRGWIRLLESNARVAQEAGDLGVSPTAEMVAFEIDAVLSAANVARNFSDSHDPLDMARNLIAVRLARP